MEGNGSVYQVNPVSRISGEGRAEFSRTWGTDFDQKGGGRGGGGEGTGGAGLFVRYYYNICTTLTLSRVRCYRHTVFARRCTRTSAGYLILASCTTVSDASPISTDVLRCCCALFAIGYRVDDRCCLDCFACSHNSVLALTWGFFIFPLQNYWSLCVITSLWP